MSFRALLFAATAAASLCRAQADLRTVASPDGQIEFRLFLEPQKDDYIRLAYQVKYKGKPLFDTSYLGVLVHNQPLLGQNIGLMAEERRKGDGYNELATEYLQNGTLGRRIAVQTRVYNEGVAFRYLIPRAGPLTEIMIEDEATEFRFAQSGSGYPLGVTGFQSDYASHNPKRPLTAPDGKELFALPFLAEQPGVGWVAIREAGLVERYAGLYLRHGKGLSYYSTIPPHPEDDSIGVQVSAPIDLPWRVLSIASDAAGALNSKLAARVDPAESRPDSSAWPHLAWDRVKADPDAALAAIERQGAKGVVVDSPIRDDQDMLTFYLQTSQAAARHNLTAEFSGRRRGGTLRLTADAIDVVK